MATQTFTGHATIPTNCAVDPDFPLLAVVSLASTEIAVDFTPLYTYTSTTVVGTLDFLATFPFPAVSISTISAELTFFELELPASTYTAVEPVLATFTTSIGAVEATSEGSSGTTGSTTLETAGASQETAPGDPLVSSSQGYSSGALAGTAVGCLFAGALLAGLATFFFMRRRQQRSRAAQSEFASHHDNAHSGVLENGHLKPDEKSPISPAVTGRTELGEMNHSELGGLGRVELDGNAGVVDVKRPGI